MLRALLALGLWAGISPALAQVLPLSTIRHFNWTEQNQFTTRMPVTLTLDMPATVEVRGFISAGQTTAAGVSPFALATPGPSCGTGVDFVEIVNRPFVIRVGAVSPRRSLRGSCLRRPGLRAERELPHQHRRRHLGRRPLPQHQLRLCQRADHRQRRQQHARRRGSHRRRAH